MRITPENAKQYDGKQVIVTDGKREAYEGKLIELNVSQSPCQRMAMHVCLPVRFPATVKHYESLGYTVLLKGT